MTMGMLVRQEARDEGRRAKTGLEPTVPALREALEAELYRVIDLMRALDMDENGAVRDQSRSHTRAICPDPVHARRYHTHTHAVCPRGPRARAPRALCAPHPNRARHTARGVQVSKAEFRKALPLLGFDADAGGRGGLAALDALFDTFDADRSGAIEYDELHRLLRKGAP